MKYNGTTITYYGDGVEMDTDTGQSNDQGVNTYDRFYIGSRVTQDSSFPGLVDDVCVFQRELTDAEIVTVMNGGAGTLPDDYYPLVSPANVYDLEPPTEKKVNFLDYDLVLQKWLEEDFFE